MGLRMRDNRLTVECLQLLHFHMFVVGNFRTNPPDVEEGICELAAVLYLRSLPQDKDRDMRIRQVATPHSGSHECVQQHV